MKQDYNLINLKNFVEQLRSTLDPQVNVNYSWGDLNELYQYNKNCQIFNRRLQFKPFVIVFCEKEADVLATFKAAKDNNLPFRVRAGGHDHEGECTGTNTILIDVSKMNWVIVEKKKGEDAIAKVGPGNRFERLTSLLADEDVMIPHGTCATVGIAGFTMGGGWGPWTRKEGMCCERLVGADIILGDGTVKKIDAKEGEPVPELLWALRGGGGMSYGIVTELRFKTFELPYELHRFELHWNCYEDLNPDKLTKTVPTLYVLEKWEELISAKDTAAFIGTNLKINAIPWKKGTPITKVDMYHNCVLYGYWEGDQDSLQAFIDSNFKGKLTPCYQEIAPATGAGFKGRYGKQLMSSWDRESLHKIRVKMGLKMGTPLQPDEDNPAPHKITSRLVNKEGLCYGGKDGYEDLLKSLSSHMVLEGNRKLGLFTYVTLGAITGDYYRLHAEENNSAFPYNDKLYTIQYQCWWNEEDYLKAEGQDNFVYDRTNRALDWIESSRDALIANTSGAFISFKDSSIPTEVYFDKSYNDLIRIKDEYSEDEYNHFRTRKTII